MLGIFLDTETNGLNLFQHRVIEIAFQFINLLTGDILETFESTVSTTREEWGKSDKESLRVNGFTWEEIQSAPTPIRIGAAIEEHFQKQGVQRGKAVFICQNPSFDRAFFSQLVDPTRQESLLWPYHWLDLASMYWAKSLEKAAVTQVRFPWETGLSKDKIAAVYHIAPEQSPHRAMNGVKHLVLCYRSVVGFPQAN